MERDKEREKENGLKMGLIRDLVYGRGSKGG